MNKPIFSVDVLLPDQSHVPIIMWDFKGLHVCFTNTACLPQIDNTTEFMWHFSMIYRPNVLLAMYTFRRTIFATLLLAKFCDCAFVTLFFFFNINNMVMGMACLTHRLNELPVHCTALVVFWDSLCLVKYSFRYYLIQSFKNFNGILHVLRIILNLDGLQCQ